MRTHKIKFSPLLLLFIITFNSAFTYAESVTEKKSDDSLKELHQYCEDVQKNPHNYRTNLKNGSIKSMPIQDKGQLRHDVLIKVNFDGTENYISCNQNFHTRLMSSSLADAIKKPATSDKSTCESCTEQAKSINPEISKLASNVNKVNNETEKIMCESTKQKSLQECATGLAYCGLENLKLAKITGAEKPKDISCAGLLKGGLGAHKDVGSCMATFIRGAFDEISQTLKFLVVDGPKWIYEKTFKNWFKEPAVNQLENVSSLEAIASSNASDEEIKEEKADPKKSLLNKITDFAENLILQKGSEAFGCEKWSSGIPGVGRCLNPPASWECASCKQKAMTLCGVSGYVGGIVIETAVLGAPVGVIAGTTVGLISKGSKVSKANNVAKARTTNKSVQKIVNAGVAVSKAGVAVLKPIVVTGYQVTKKSLEVLTLIPGVALTANILASPIKGMLKVDDFLVSKTWNLTYHGSKAYTQALAKTGDVSIALEAAKTASKLAQLEKAGSALLHSQVELVDVAENLKVPNASAIERKIAQNKKVDLLIVVDKQKAKYEKLRNNLSETELNSAQQLPAIHTNKLADKFQQTEKKLIVKSEELKKSDDVAEVKKLTLQDIKADDLAKLIAVDEETRKLVSDPLIAQYIYVNHFLPNPKDNEIKLVLQKIVDSASAGQQDLFTLVNKTLVDKLNDPKIKEAVQAAFKNEENILRPGATETKLYPAKAKIKQIVGMPETLVRIKKLTYEGFDQEVMDRGLFDFYGATQLGLKESQLRQWDNIPGGFEAIRPGQVENMSPDLWAKMAMFASETEAPIHGYSTNSGEALRGLMPSISAFMGKNEDQYLAYEEAVKAFQTGKREEGVSPFCSNVWCSEEKRHENAVQKISEHVTGKPKTMPGTYEADKMGDFSDADYALKHLVGRNSSEWNANSIYLYLRSHSNGAANKWVDNVRKDETKHMAIFSSAYKYVFGNQPGKRTKEMIDKIRHLKAVASETNSSGDILSGDMTSLFEIGVTHLFVEKKVRDFTKSVPLKTMEKIYDTPVKTLKEIESVPLTPQKEKAILEMNEREERSRQRLERWLPKERAKYLALKEVEKKHADLIESLIVNLFDSFRGAEVPNSQAVAELHKKIDKLRTGLDSKTNALIQLSLKETLRDYQIMNNSFVRNHPGLKVRLKSATEGFVVEHKGPGEAEVLLAQEVTDSTFKLRVKKPADLDVKPGQAMRIAINTPSGEEFRVLSLASSPSKDYLEFAVGVSDSNFKQSFIKLKPGTTVTVGKAKGSMNFDPESPAVMIAGGIGITPFRSMINYVKDENLKTPMYLYYANKNQIPFGNEFTEIAASTPQLDLTTILSKPEADWKGPTGRIDEPFLRAEVSRLPENSKYYIVGPTPMVTGVKKNLMDLGVKEENINIEIFATSPAPASTTTADGKTIPIKDLDAKPKDKTVCLCHSVTAGQIEAAIDGGATTLSAIQNKTMAATGCGGCECNVMDILSCKMKPTGK